MQQIQKRKCSNAVVISAKMRNALLMDSLLWSSEDVPVMCAGQADSGRVDDGHQLFNVFHQHSVEEPLVSLLDAHQVNVPGR